MTDRARNRGAKTLSASVIIGTLLVPVSAAAAFWLTDPGSGDDSATAATERTTTTVVSPETTHATTVALSEDALRRGDLEQACGPAGMKLVALEEDGSITDVQQAALDALRDICEQEELPLPGRSQPEPIVQTVVVTETAPSPPTTMPHVDDDHDDDGWDDHDDDEEEDGDHEDDEDHEDDDEDHEDHEDDHEDHEDD